MYWICPVDFSSCSCHTGEEELNTLKEEVETVSRKLHELTDEELAQVSGGVEPPDLDLKSLSLIHVVERRSQFKRFETVETDYFNALKFVNKTTGIVNKTYVQIMEALGYDIELTYVKRTG